MASVLRFDSKVALITGAGSELGRQCAIDLAKRGAAVLVNDMRTVYTGRSEPSYLCDLLVEEIRSFGGIAEANHDSVRYGERIVRSALEAFGRIDIIINCGVFARDLPFHKVDNTDWALMARINLRGAFLVLKAAWPHMKKQKAGRIVNIETMMGEAGWENRTVTTAAKMGLHGLTKALATEGKKYNIHMNTIAALKPKAVSEATLFPDSQVTPLVLWLAHENCKATGEKFEAGGGLIAKLRIQRSSGVHFPTNFQAEDVRRLWSKLLDFQLPTDSPCSIAEALAKFKQAKLCTEMEMDSW